MRKDGTCFVNLGDSYASTAGGGVLIPTKEYKQSLPYTEHTRRIKSGEYKQLKTYPVYPKSLCLIPQRFAIEMVNRKWILRNEIIWHKPNCMPSSANDRFTVDFEYLFFFTKNNKAIFWTNGKTLECVDKKPLGTKGIEGIDWEWRKQEIWDETNATSRRSEIEGYLGYSERMHSKTSKIIKKKKVSLWTGHDYWFEQQFEELAYIDKRGNQRIAYKGKLDKSRNDFNVQPVDYFGQPGQGKNKRCVWKIPTQPFPEAHFATYPEALIEIPIKAGCPPKTKVYRCKKCDKIYSFDKLP